MRYHKTGSSLSTVKSRNKMVNYNTQQNIQINNFVPKNDRIKIKTSLDNTFYKEKIKK